VFHNLREGVDETDFLADPTAELAVSQPAISKAITGLEQVLGVRLLD
jgi:hypothetical protein